MSQKETVPDQILDGPRYNAYHVAQYLLEFSNTLLTPLQINKLVFLSHGWHLGIENKALINEAVEAWQYGPVIPSIYQTFKMFGKGVIESDVHYDSQFHVPFNDDAKNIMEQVIEIYGDYSGNKLVKLTHERGSPWSECYNSENWAIVIPDEIIKKYYKSQYDEGQKENASDNL